MGFSDKDFQNPNAMFDARTRTIRVRIQNMQKHLVVAQHPFTKAVLIQEIGKATDEYVARSIRE